MNPKGIAILALLLTASSVMAQTPARVDKLIPCPYPDSSTISAPASGASTFVPSEYPPSLPPLIAGSVWNQPGADKAFGYTFRYRLPNPHECCAITGGRLVINIKALQNATSVTSPDAGNDGINVYVAGAQVGAATPWLGGANAGATKTVTIALPASAFTNGFISFYVQDDTAVQSAQLQIDRCCIKPSRATE